MRRTRAPLLDCASKVGYSKPQQQMQHCFPNLAWADQRNVRRPQLLATQCMSCRHVNGCQNGQTSLFRQLLVIGLIRSCERTGELLLRTLALLSASKWSMCSLCCQWCHTSPLRNSNQFASVLTVWPQQEHLRVLAQQCVERWEFQA